MRKVALFVGAIAMAFAVLPAPPAAAGSSFVFIGGPEFGFSLCAEFGDAPNNWVLTVELGPTTFVQYGSPDADKTKFAAGRNEGILKDKLGIAVETNSNPITASIEAIYADGGVGKIVFAQTAPIKATYKLKGPAAVDESGNCSAVF